MHRNELDAELDAMRAELADWATQTRRREIFQAQFRNLVQPLLERVAADDRGYAHERILAMLEGEGVARELALEMLSGS